MNALSQTKTARANCPSCDSAESFGPRFVRGQYWITRCSKCPHYTSLPLPKISKKIIYLDQYVLSDMLKAKDARWGELLTRLRLLKYLHVITCPYSKVHMEESLLAETSRAELKGLYRELSDGNTFLSPIDIEQHQLRDAIGHWLRGEDNPWSKSQPWETFCEDDPHRWASDLAIHADFPLDPARVERLKEYKERLHADLVTVAENWKGETNSFKDDVKREASSYGKAMIEGYRELAGARNRIEAKMPPDMRAAFQAAFGPKKFDPNTPPGVQPGVMLVRWLASAVHKAGPNEADPVRVVEEFFHSNHATDVPFQYIASRLWASIANQVRGPTPRKPKPGDNYDVTAISHYAPYCDAMIVDREFYAIASQNTIDVPGKFGVRMFSSKTLGEFLRYLDEVRDNIPRDHRIAVKQVYPHLVGLQMLATDDSAAETH